MKKANIFATLAEVASHIIIILGLNLMVLLVIDVFFNRAMNFLGNKFFKFGSMALIVCAIYLAVVHLYSAYGRKK